MSEEDGATQALGVRDLRAALVGRDAAMASLKYAADRSRQNGQTRVVTLVGANGLGKTRVVHDLLEELRSAGGRLPRVYRGSGRGSGQSYGVFARLLRARFGLVEGMDAEGARAGVRDQVQKVLHDRKVEEFCFFLGHLLDLPFGDSPLTRAVADDPSEARLLRRTVVKCFLEGDAAMGPLCLVFDDADDADDDSLDLLRYLMAQLSGPILVIAGVRPEFASKNDGWFSTARDRHDRIDLGPVSNDQAVAIARALLAPCEGGAPESLVEAAVSMAGGNPGLIDAMVRVYHDVGVLSDRDPMAAEPVWAVDLDRLASARLPMTVEDAVSVRVSALRPAERRVLEHAAVMGSVFWLGGLIALGRQDRDAPEFWRPGDMADVQEVEATLGELVARDHVLRLPDSSLGDEVEYVFKHNREREKLLELTSVGAAKRHHQTIGDWLAQKDHVRSQEEFTAMLAAHLEQAGIAERAGATFIAAGDLARQNFAAKKAHEHYQRGLKLLGDADVRRRIDALHNHGDVLLALGKTDEALAAFREMLELSYRLRIKSKGGAAHNRIGRLHRDTGALLVARQHLDTALTLFSDAKDDRGVAACHDDIGKLLWMKGEYDEALKELMVALDMRKLLADRRSIALSLNNIGMVWLDHGRAARAREALEAALQVRREIDDPLGVAQSLDNLGKLAVDQNELPRALGLFREAYELVKEIGEQNRIAAVLTNIGETHYRLGDSAEAIRILKQAEELCDELGDKLHLAEAKRGLAKAYLMQNDLRKAREAIKHAVDLFGQVRSRAHLAIALRTLGEVTAAGAWGEGHEVKAVDYFMRSIAICKEIGNELEVAKSYRAFSSYVQKSSHYLANADIQREGKKLSEMADEIFARQKIQASGSS